MGEPCVVCGDPAERQARKWDDEKGKWGEWTVRCQQHTPSRYHEGVHWRDRRYGCQNCETKLTGRQERWCSPHCSHAWFTPVRLWHWLWQKQEGLCGICVLPIDISHVKLEGSYGPPEDRVHYSMIAENGICWVSARGVEVDHVVPRSRDGSRRVENLRTAHRECNQGKKDKSLDEYRFRIGAFEDVVAERLEEVGEDATGLLVEPRVSRTPPEEWWGRILRPKGRETPQLIGQGRMGEAAGAGAK